MSSLYADIPLSRPDKQIRLLRLEQSSSDCDDYCFSLAAHEFHDDVRPSYIAISYTWGNTVPLLPIFVNGKKMRVRHNCWYSLWQIRHHGLTDYLWIDSLCINQDNDEEKNFQVAMMGSIYESALWVASCIGTGETISVMEPGLMSDSEEAKLARMRLRESFDQIPYFDRVWIKQEIILGRDITLFYGLKRISWEKFDLLMNMEQRLLERKLNSEESADSGIFDALDNGAGSSGFYELSRAQEMLLQETETNSAISQLCNHRSRPMSGTFVDLVLRYKTAKATNSRDKIYALLSLLPKEDPIRQNLVVDYGQPTFNLFHTIIRLVYSAYEDTKYGQKHQVLGLIREWLGINETNVEMNDYLKSVPSSPSDWLPSSISDLAGSWLNGIDPHIMLDVMEMCKIGAQDEINLNLDLKPEEYTPLALIKHINTWRRNDEKWTKKDMQQLVPINLKTTRVVFIRPTLHMSISPNMKEFLANADVRAGDFIAKILWDGPKSSYHVTAVRTVAHAVLRAVDVSDKDKEEDILDDSAMDTSEDMFDSFLNHLSEQGNSPGVILKLHSWAIPVGQDLTLLTENEESDSSYAHRNQSLSRLKLHHRDLLIPLILNNTPLYALLYPAPEGSYFSTVQSDNDVESLDQKRQPSSPSKSEVDYNYLRDVLG
ncbi:16895c3d-3416-4bef-ace5-77ec91e60ed3 [Sclerotinia trifoliorum]|uniref:16895c3d-3416-4bef-ace5-77ec91e60ed3 n=1 Tax=Sclerotinia trifoliorum TaxID=28548 RepID=A0A8H2ZSZ4_9HELO|nr:16895c3d-3416-4bef-ace5-77ec91e60ed3 [Sclerotinia trifoliorum]